MPKVHLICYIDNVNIVNVRFSMCKFVPIAPSKKVIRNSVQST